MAKSKQTQLSDLPQELIHRLTSPLLAQAKIGILVGSLVSAALGISLLLCFLPKVSTAEK